MAIQAVPSDRPIAVKRKQGQTVTISNPGAVDVYFDGDYNVLAATLKGAVPNGTKIAAGTASFQFPEWPDDRMFFRAAQDTTIFIEP